MKRTILVATLVLGSSVCSQSFGFDLLDRMLGLKGCGAHSTCCDTVVCDTGAYGCAAEPACGCEAPCGGACVADPACGCEAPCGGAFGGACGCAEPACGFEAPCAPACEPTCGAASACCGNGHGGLLGRLFGHHGNHGCDTGCCAEPACGCEAPCGGLGCVDPACGCEVAGPIGCDSGCCGGSKRPHLLARLFGGHGCCDSGCDTACCDAMPSGCGCSTGVAAPVAAPPVQIQDAAPMPPAPVVDPSAYLNSKRRVIQASARYVR